MPVIKNPKPSRGHYGTWLGEGKQPTLRDKLREQIDAAVIGCKSFDDFIIAMKQAGAEVKPGKNIAFKAPGQQRFIRCNSLEDGYSEASIRDRISGKQVVMPKKKSTQSVKGETTPSLLIDIQEKIKQGYGPGFERYAKIHNLKEAAKTLLFLQEQGLTEYETLAVRAEAAGEKFNSSSVRIKTIEARQKKISSLQKHIGTYTKTLPVFRQYRDGGKSKKFYAQHESDIIAHRAAKKAFDVLGLKKLPTMQKLKTEYATLDAEKKKLYQGYRQFKEDMITLYMAKQNVDKLLGIIPEPKKALTQDMDSR